MFRPRIVDVFRMAVLGVIVGGFLGGVAGGGLGFLAGSINEATLTGEEDEELFVGFADFSARSMCIFGAMICGVLGAVGGLFGAAIGSVRQSALVGILVGGFVVCVPLLAHFYISSSVGHWHEDEIVVILGSTAGVSAAVAYTRLIQRFEARENSASR